MGKTNFKVWDDISVPYTITANVSGVIADTKEEAMEIAHKMVEAAIYGTDLDDDVRVELNNDSPCNADVDCYHDIQVSYPSTMNVEEMTDNELEDYAAQKLRPFEVEDSDFDIDIENVEYENPLYDEYEDDDEDKMITGSVKEARVDECSCDITILTDSGHSVDLSDFSPESQRRILEAIVTDTENYI